MKLPRWLVVTLLTASLLAVVVAGGWWWVTWPQRTMDVFAKLIAARRIDEANTMIAIPKGRTSGHARFAGEHLRAEVKEFELQRPSWIDLLCGRRTFKRGLIVSWDVKVVVERGEIIARTEDGENYGISIDPE
jgi:hypothetical protein